MIQLDWLESQILYYSKNWFKSTEVFSDIKKLCSHYFDTDMKYYSNAFIIDSVIELYFKVNQNYPLKQKNKLVKYFIGTDFYGKAYDKTDKGVTEYFLQCIASTIVQGNLLLKEIDYTVLEKRDND